MAELKKRVVSGFGVSILLAVWGGLPGCGEGPKIVVSYEKPPEYKIPAKIKKVAVVQFGDKTGGDQKWGEIASDSLASSIDKLNKDTGRYELVSRKRIAAVMDENDFQTSVSDTDTAAKVGKVAGVDAMIYGTVYVTKKEEDKSGNMPSIGVPRFSMGSMHSKKTKYFATVATTFTMIDVKSSKTLCTRNITKEYDSGNKEDKKRYKGGGAVEKVAAMMVKECVAEFMGLIGPSTVEMEIQLEKGKSKAVKNGNKFAKSGEYSDAIDLYSGAMGGSDKGAAAFNTGACYEALGKFADAEKFYDQAVKSGDPKEKYIVARKRVRGAK